MRHRHSIFLGILGAWTIQSFVLYASDWPQWRGPTGMGYSEDKDLPLTWGGKDDQNIRWKVPLPKTDTSQSSPIVWKDRIFVTTAQTKPPTHEVTCYGKGDGKQLWSTSVPLGPWILTDLRGGYSCATPATDGERVYALFGSATLAALDFEGKIVWQKTLDPRAFDVAISSSPVVYKENVILLCDQRDKLSYIVAYDRKTGAETWRQKRPKMFFSHTTPLLVQINRKPQLLISASSALQGLDPENGNILWWCASKGDVPTPVFSGGRVYVDDGRGGPGICVDPNGSGDVSATHVKWTRKTGVNGMNSAIIVGERLYKISTDLRCMNLATGEDVWTAPVGGDFNPSPVATADGLIFYASAGRSWVLRAGDKFDLLGKSELGESSSASPAVSDGCIILKGSKNLFCVGKK